MSAEEIAQLLSQRVKQVRVEFNLTQEKMATLLGLSKKTLIQVEKNRILLQWSAVVTLCALFNHSQVLRTALGDEPLEVVKAAVFPRAFSPTMGGKIWWREVASQSSFKIQQNLVSGHYRILDGRNQRWYSSFDLAETQELLQSLAQLAQRGHSTC